MSIRSEGKYVPYSCDFERKFVWICGLKISVTSGISYYQITSKERLQSLSDESFGEKDITKSKINRFYHSMRTQKHSYSFLKSAFAREGHFMQNENVVQWLAEQNTKVKVQVHKVRFLDLSGWVCTDTAIRHDSGRFFSIEGIRVKTNWGKISQWDQPIINQPEIGYLGFISKEFDGMLHLLVQAKIEPGNVNHVQISPTLQATRSNYSQVHKGRRPLYLEYFLNARPHQIMLDQLQSEQGARFLKKRNRNIIINVKEDIPLYKKFYVVDTRSDKMAHATEQFCQHGYTDRYFRHSIRRF